MHARLAHGSISRGPRAEILARGGAPPPRTPHMAAAKLIGPTRRMLVWSTGQYAVLMPLDSATLALNQSVPTR